MTERARPIELINPKNVGRYLLAFPTTGCPVTVQKLLLTYAIGNINTCLYLLQSEGNGYTLSPAYLRRQITSWENVLRDSPEGFSSDVLSFANMGKKRINRNWD